MAGRVSGHRRRLPSNVLDTSGHHHGVGRLINRPRMPSPRRADCADQSVEAPTQRPHERTWPSRRRPALTVALPPQSHRQTHKPSPAYRSVVSWPNTSPPRRAGEPGRDRHTRRCSRQPQSRVRPLFTASNSAVTWPPHRHAQSQTPAPRY
jgi:hypothetical protein